MISIAIFCQPLHPAQTPLNAHQKIIIITTGMMHLSTTQTKCCEEDWNHPTVPPLHFTFRLLNTVALLFQISPGRAFCCLGMTTWLTYISFLPYSLSNYANQLESCHLCIWMSFNWKGVLLWFASMWTWCQNLQIIQAKYSIEPKH